MKKVHTYSSRFASLFETAAFQMAFLKLGVIHTVKISLHGGVVNA
jgi:hypothetical protein